MGKITDDELAMLSPEERDALDGDTENKSTDEIKAEEEAAAAAKAKEDGAVEAKRVIEKKAIDEKAAEAEKAEAEKIEEEAKAKAAAEAEEAAAAQAAKEAADLEAAKKAEEAAAAAEAVIAPKVEPIFILEAEKKHGTKEEIEAKMSALDAKFEDGDVTLAAYNKERAEYVEALTEIKMFEKINAQVQKAAAEKGWKDAQADFFRLNPEYSVERIKNVAFVDAVNRLLATEESKRMTDAQILEMAKKECDTVFHPSEAPKVENVKDTAAEEKRAAIEAAKKAEAERAAEVKTLAKVPVSEGNQGDDKYDAIDKLTGEAYENAVAKMSDAERAIYAARS